MLRKLVIVVVFAFIVCLVCSQAEATVKFVVFGNTIWVSGDNRLTLEMPSVLHPYLKVTSNTAADLQWISAMVPFTWGSTIKGIILCYQTPDLGTYISQIRLAEYALPTPANVKHDDGTDLFDVVGNCFYSPVASYTPTGAVNLSLRLNFGTSGNEIRLGALAVEIDEP